MIDAERERLRHTPTNHGWKEWGPYLAERQWGTVREDYSHDGNAWNYVTHDLSRSKAYRWGEDGIAGYTDGKNILCFSVALWNEKDPIIKERLFGLANAEGNHGEDVKELYYYLDATPTHSYLKMLYKYPIDTFPYNKLVEENRKRSRLEPEFEILETGVFDNNRYFDVFIEYAKVSPFDTLIKISAYNRSQESAVLHLLPTLWYRNTWSWGYPDYSYRPIINWHNQKALYAQHPEYGNYWLYYQGNGKPLFCNNETNPKRFQDGTNSHSLYFKDGINNFFINGFDTQYINLDLFGTKASIWYASTIEPHQSVTIRLRLCQEKYERPFEMFEEVFAQRIKEANEFYSVLQKNIQDEELKNIQRQAYAGMIWSKQRYYYNVNEWMNGDPALPKPPEHRKYIRNYHWQHLYNANILSMPDKWEYPWYAAWDLAFHCIPLARLDPEFAKRQLVLMLREYYMHPNGQIPAYEWNFGDTNPPVHAWGAWKVYCIDKEMNGKGDTDFLSKVFHKLLMNFTWWVNQKDAEGNNIFEGGFLGLDNIGVFDRSKPLPTGGTIEQADGTSWMAMYSLNMLRIAIELAKEKPYYQETASKFFDHFLRIAGSLANLGGSGLDLWDEEDEFYYDILHPPHGKSHRLKVRSLVGLVPLFAVETLSPSELEGMPDFQRRLEWMLKHRPDLAKLISRWHVVGHGDSHLLALLRLHRLKCILRHMLDENEFLSEYGIRSLSRYHLEHPYRYYIGDQVWEVKYVPGDSDSSMFGGNSNWRGPIWFPMNFLIIESLLQYYEYYGDSVQVQFPTGSGNLCNLKEVAIGIAKRLINIFLPNEQGKRPVHATDEVYATDPHFKHLVLFYEYFHGDNGKGLGASHQTGWTGLVAELIHWVSQNK
ncbi:MAG: glucosidase [Cytophagales bacterium]|nr:glucosidase [Cytophagales bacterium]MDW8383749.1 glucosidase [Flammeovirgaceae bacterium]